MEGIMISPHSGQSLFLRMCFDGNDLASGTGFVVDSRLGPVLITNRHNVTGRHQVTGRTLSDTGGLPNQMVIYHTGPGPEVSWVQRVEPLYHDDRPLWREHPTLGEAADVIALPLTNLSGASPKPYQLDPPGVDLIWGLADPVSVIGFPFGKSSAGYLAIWATGFVASDPEIDYDGLPQFLIDCRTRPGQSGSAVIAYRSGGAVPTRTGIRAFDRPVFRFLGIYSGRIRTDSDIGTVWKTSAIAELVNSI